MMIDSNKLLLRHDGHEQNRAATLESLWKNSDFVDVTLACDDGMLSAHQVILSAVSPFFLQILHKNPQKHPFIHLKGTHRKDMELLLEYVYSGKAEICQDELPNFLELARSFQLEGLEAPVNEIEAETIFEQIQPPEKPKSTRHKQMKNEKIEAVEVSEIGCVNSFDVLEEQSSVLECTKKGVSWNVNYLGNEASVQEYEKKKTELIFSTEDNLWQCSMCSYVRKQKSHVVEHTEKHIDGFQFKCNNCNTTYNRRSSLRKCLYLCSK